MQAVTVVLGSQWGDEGKGKLVDILAAEADLCARCAGGNNAGHTIVVPMGPNRIKTTLDFHLLPSGEPRAPCHRIDADKVTGCSGLVNPNCVGLIGNGVVVHLPSFFAELDKLTAKGIIDGLPKVEILTNPRRTGLRRETLCF